MREDTVINGQVAFYDEACSWGLIRGEDGCLYDLRAAQLPGATPQVGERVVFEPQPAPGGPRAGAVRRLGPTSAPRGAGKP